MREVVSQNADMLAPMAVDAVLKVIDPKTATNVDLTDIRLCKKLGGRKHSMPQESFCCCC